jgi:trypsin
MRRLVCSLGVLVAVGCSAAPSVGVVGEPVIHGTLETGYPEVVAVYWQDPSGGATATGGLCSGTVIGPHAIMTAKHCVFQETTPPVAVPNDWFYVIEGSDIMHPTGLHHPVAEVRTTPGTDVNSDVMNGSDIAILLIADTLTPRITARGYATQDPTIGEAVTVVGFGRTMTGTPMPTDAGIKYSGPMTIRGFNGTQILAGGTSWTCQGDSGGPLIDPQGNVCGITSFGFDSTCAYPRGVFTSVAAWTSLIQDALTWAPPCMPTNEVCNGLDDDCDHMIDEGLTCAPMGATCTMNHDCASGRCGMTRAGMVCTQSCFPDTMIDPCPTSFHCEVEDCGRGFCVMGAPGAGVPGTTCTADTDCVSGYCALLQGRHLCGQQCVPSLGSGCGDGLDCDIATGSTCGACVPTALSMGPHPLGSACTTDVNCASMHCAMPGGYCTQPCASQADCPSTFHCSGTMCAPGSLAMQGGACSTASDCASSAPDCIDGQCAATCAAGSTTCGIGFECDAATMHCSRGGAPLGGACTSNDMCRSGLCTSLGSCTVLCDAMACPSGFDCVDAGGPHVCVAHVAPPASSSCGCRVGAHGAAPTFLLLVLAGLVARRRARRS